MMQSGRQCLNCYSNTKNKHGYTLVPIIFDENPRLGIWVSYQRAAYIKNVLLDHRVQRLNYIGFVWKIFERLPWIDMFHRLVSYKEEHDGSTLVPAKLGKDPKLGFWVGNQRHLLKNNKVSNDRATLLKSIGFGWGGMEWKRNILAVGCLCTKDFFPINRNTMGRLWFQEGTAKTPSSEFGSALNAQDAAKKNVSNF